MVNIYYFRYGILIIIIMPTREWGLPCILKAKEKGEKKEKKGRRKRKRASLREPKAGTMSEARLWSSLDKD